MRPRPAAGCATIEVLTVPTIITMVVHAANGERASANMGPSVAGPKVVYGVREFNTRLVTCASKTPHMAMTRRVTAFECATLFP